MDRAWESGIHWFDTADAYGGGRSESCIGRWRAARKPEGLVLTTKVFNSTVGDPDDVGLAPDRIRRQLEGSLARLGVDRIDLYLAHEPDPQTPLAETIACFERLVAGGADRRLGALQLRPRRHRRGAPARAARRSSRTRTRCSTAATSTRCCRSARRTGSRTSRSARSPAAG